jgi:hypothetical protein
VFVEYSTEVAVPASRLSRLFLANLAEMEGFGTAAYRRGEELHSRVGPGGPLAKDVVVALGSPHMTRAGMAVPVTWRATGAQALFPRLEGDLVVEGSGPERSSLHLRASYRPPLGSVGDLVDRLLLARLARSTVADWVDRMAEWAVEADSRQTLP